MCACATPNEDTSTRCLLVSLSYVVWPSYDTEKTLLMYRSSIQKSGSKFQWSWRHDFYESLPINNCSKQSPYESLTYKWTNRNVQYIADNLGFLTHVYYTPVSALFQCRSETLWFRHLDGSLNGKSCLPRRNANILASNTYLPYHVHHCLLQSFCDIFTTQYVTIQYLSCWSTENKNPLPEPRYMYSDRYLPTQPRHTYNETKSDEVLFMFLPTLCLSLPVETDWKSEMMRRN